MDIVFWGVAAVSVVLTGLSKGGFAGLSVLSLPLFALVISPIQGAAVMLPILMMQDCVSVWAYRKSFDRRILAILVAGSFIGMVAGGLLATRVSNASIEILVGAIAAGFVARALLRRHGSAVGASARPSPSAGVFWGAIAGFTSFIANSGAPPFQVYVMPQRLPPSIYAGTATMFFAVINLIKFFIFFAIGQVSFVNLRISLVLFPVAIASALLGVWLIRRIDADRFYATVMVITFVVGIYLIWHGFTDISGGWAS